MDHNTLLLKPFDEKTRIVVSFGDDTHTIRVNFKRVLAETEKFVAAIAQVVREMRDNDYAKPVCQELVRHLHTGQWSMVVLNPDDNLYEVLPYELDSLRVFLHNHQQKYDLTKQRTAFYRLITELWQLLPGFYKWQGFRFDQPRGYDSQQPYPHLQTLSPYHKAKFRFRSDYLVDLNGQASDVWPKLTPSSQGTVPAMKLLDDFENFVAEVKHVATTMKRADFDFVVCQELLKTFYASAQYVDTPQANNGLVHRFGALRSLFGRLHDDYDLQTFENKYTRLNLELNKYGQDFNHGYKVCGPSNLK